MTLEAGREANSNIWASGLISHADKKKTKTKIVLVLTTMYGEMRHHLTSVLNLNQLSTRPYEV